MSEVRNARIAGLLRDPRVWTARDLAGATGLSTGYPPLDACLPGGGWPVGALTELIHDRPGIGELTLLAPALSRLAAEKKAIALIGAPYRACAPAWARLGVPLDRLLLVQARDAADRSWAAEQALRSGAFGAALLWLRMAGERELRRLQLAAEQGGALAFLFRPASALAQPSPAALRLKLSPGLGIDIVKSRGGSPRSLQLDLPDRPRRSARSVSHVVAMPLPAAPATRCAR